MYSAEVLDHFEHPRNAGTLSNADAAVRLENPACGDQLELTLRIAGGRIDAIRFRAKGCVAAVACGSALTERATGKTLGEAESLSHEEIVATVGGLPASSMHASHLAIDALRAALRAVLAKN